MLRPDARRFHPAAALEFNLWQREMPGSFSPIRRRHPASCFITMIRCRGRVVADALWRGREQFAAHRVLLAPNGSAIPRAALKAIA